MKSAVITQIQLPTLEEIVQTGENSWSMVHLDAGFTEPEPEPTEPETEPETEPTEPETAPTEQETEPTTEPTTEPETEPTTAPTEPVKGETPQTGDGDIIIMLGMLMGSMMLLMMCALLRWRSAKEQ